MSASPFDHPQLAPLLGDPEIAALFAPEARIAAYLRYEAALARAEAEAGLIPHAAADAIALATTLHEPDAARLSAGVAADGVAIPAFVKELRAALPAEHRAHLHVGATSQDLIDTADAQAWQEAAGLIAARLEALIEGFDALERTSGDQPMMGRTRLRPARPLLLRDRIAAWREPLVHLLARGAELGPRVYRVQFGGAAGNRADVGDAGEAIAAQLAEEFGLHAAPCWHSQREGVAEFAGWLAGVSGALGKFGQDVGLLSMPEIGEIALKGGGGSSAMPGKVNPVAAEVLVTLARFNAALLGGVGQATVHEWERSGAAWTLEWMLMPQICVAAGASTLRAGELLAMIEAA